MGSPHNDTFVLNPQIEKTQINNRPTVFNEKKILYVLNCMYLFTHLFN